MPKNCKCLNRNTTDSEMESVTCGGYYFSYGGQRRHQEIACELNEQGRAMQKSRAKGDLRGRKALIKSLRWIELVNWRNQEKALRL